MSGIADHTRSFLGRKLLRLVNVRNSVYVILYVVLCEHFYMHMYSLLCRLWFTRPLRDLTVLQQRLDAISLLTSPRHVDVTSSLSDCLKHIKNIPVSCVHVCTFMACLNELVFHAHAYSVCFSLNCVQCNKCIFSACSLLSVYLLV